MLSVSNVTLYGHGDNVIVHLTCFHLFSLIVCLAYSKQEKYSGRYRKVLEGICACVYDFSSGGSGIIIAS